MTCIIRKDDFLCTDSLIFNGATSSIFIEFQNKIQRNKLGTALLIYCGQSFQGNLNKYLENLSNIIVNKEILNEDINLSILDIEYLRSLQLTEFHLLIATKNKTYVLKEYQEQIVLYTYEKDELVIIGTGALYLTTQDLSNKTPLDLMIQVIQNESTCFGPINTFDLTQLKEIQHDHSI